MSTAAASPAAALRIGEVARHGRHHARARSATTRRSACSPARPAASRASTALYGEAEVERLRDALRLKELLGLSLDELKAVLEAEEARAAIRAELLEGDPTPSRRRELLEEALGHIERQLELVRRRRDEIAELERELLTRRTRVRRKLAALDG